MSETTKKCIKCDCEKNINEFGKLKASKDGFHYYCLVCVRNYANIKYHENKEQSNKDKREKYKTQPSKMKASAKKWYWGNIDKARLQARTRYYKKKELLKNQDGENKSNVENNANDTDNPIDIVPNQNDIRKPTIHIIKPE